MKKLLTASLPALALFALGGCAASHSVATTEDDGVYYSRQDRTTAVARAIQPQSAAPQGQSAPAGADDEAANPDYQASAGTRRPAANAPEYYDDNYNTESGYSSNRSRFRRPYAGPTVGLAYYAPPVIFAPIYNDFAFGNGFNSWGYSPFGGAFYDPFFSPYAFGRGFYNPYAFYSPFGYGFGGPFVSFHFGFGQPWGGGFGQGFGGWGHDPFFNNGFYGGGGFQGRGYRCFNRNIGNGGYYGGNQPVVYANGNGGNGGSSNPPVLVGRRGSRGGDVLADRSPATGSNVPPAAGNSGRRHMDGGAPISGIAAPAAPAPAANAPGAGNSGRRRMDGGPVSAPAAPNRPTPIAANPDQPGTRVSEEAGSRDTNEQPGRYAAPAGAPAEPGRASRGRWRNLDEGGAGTAAGNIPAPARGYEQPTQPDTQPDAQPQPTERPVRRGRFAENAPDNAQNDNGYGGRRAEQPVVQPERQPEQPEQPERTYERPQRTQEQPQRSYEAPQRTEEQPQRSYEQPQRSYEQPQRTQEQPQRSYEQPQRAERSERSYSPAPSYSSPASSGGSGGSGGGGGGGGGQRGGRW